MKLPPSSQLVQTVMLEQPEPDPGGVPEGPEKRMRARAAPSRRAEGRFANRGGACLYWRSRPGGTQSFFIRVIEGSFFLEAGDAESPLCVSGGFSLDTCR